MAVTAIDALRYAFRRDLLVLYAALFLGMELTRFRSLFPGYYEPLDRVLATATSVVTFAILVGILVAILHTVLTDVVQSDRGRMAEIGDE